MKINFDGGGGLPINMSVMRYRKGSSIKHNSFKLLKISRAGKYCFQGLLHKHNSVDSKYKFWSMNVVLTKYQKGKAKYRLKSEYNNFITVLQ